MLELYFSKLLDIIKRRTIKNNTNLSLKLDTILAEVKKT